MQDRGGDDGLVSNSDWHAVKPISGAFYRSDHLRPWVAVAIEPIARVGRVKPAVVPTERVAGYTALHPPYEPSMARTARANVGLSV